MVEVLGSCQYLLQVLFEPMLQAFSRHKTWLKKAFKFLVLAIAVIGVATSSSRVSAGFKSLDQAPEENIKNLEAAWKEGIKLGYSEAAVAGMMGNANAESTWDPGLVESNGVGLGLFQWSFERRTAYENWMKENKVDMNDKVAMSKASMDYMDVEFKQGNAFATYVNEAYIRQQYPNKADEALKILGKNPPQSLEDFKKMKNAKAAALAFVFAFERPADWALAQSWGERLDVAEEVLKKYAGTASVDDSDSSDDSSSDSSNGSSVSDALAEFSEDAIPNMPTDRDYKEEGLTFNEKVQQAQDDLVQDDKTGIEKWKSEREDNLASTSIDYIRMGIVLMSLFLLLAPTVLMMAYFSDLWLIGLDSPVLRLVTFNRLAVDYQRTGGTGFWFADKNQNKHLTTKRVGAGDLLVWSAIFSIVGILGISGYLFTAFGGLWQYVADALGYIVSLD